tara:strand:+ start:18032 stop:18934 length:903 start_codon:yes stop_codon:yes gene_type:complete
MKYFYVVCLIFLIFSCKKDSEIINNNNAPYYSEIPTLLIENYVNRVYIDLIGREPLDQEMINDVQFLRAADVSLNSRDSLLTRLQYDTTFVEGDSSYKFAYFHRIYEMMKVRLIEGTSNSYLGSELNTFYNNYVQDSINGNMLDAYKRLLNYSQLNNVVESELQYYHGEIEINEMCRRMIFNPVYDNINMNTFNFVNAAFDNLLFRYPTQYEFDQVYTMIDDNTAQIVLGSSGNNKEDFTYIISETREFYQGMIIWTYNTLLARNPTSIEVDLLMNDFYFSHDYQWLQRQIMKTDEYAHF